MNGTTLHFWESRTNERTAFSFWILRGEDIPVHKNYGKIPAIAGYRGLPHQGKITVDGEVGRGTTFSIFALRNFDGSST